MALFAGDGAITDIGAVIHIVPADLFNQFIGAVFGLIDIVAQGAGA